MCSAPAPVQAERAPSVERPTRLTDPVGCENERRTPVELPRYNVDTPNSANPASTTSRSRARPNAPESPDSTFPKAERSVSTGDRPKATDDAAPPPPAAPIPSTNGNASSAGGAPWASVNAAETIPSTSTTPLRRDTPTAPAATATTVTVRSRRTPLVVVVLSAKRTSAWLVSSTSTMHPSAPPREAAAKPSSTTDWASIINHRPVTHRHPPPTAHRRPLIARPPPGH